MKESRDSKWSGTAGLGHTVAAYGVINEKEHSVRRKDAGN